MEYCDLIAALAVQGLKAQTTDMPVNFYAIKRKLDLDEKDGSMLSTDKIITCSDNRGNKYKITVQAI